MISAALHNPLPCLLTEDGPGVPHIHKVQGIVQHQQDNGTRPRAIKWVTFLYFLHELDIKLFEALFESFDDFSPESFIV